MKVDLDPPHLVFKFGCTEEDFYRLSGEDSDWEYLDGKIVMHSPASYRHEALFRLLFTVLSAYLDKRGGAQILGSRFPMRLDQGWSPEPDLLVVVDEHSHRITEQRLEGPADLVVEIVWESDSNLVYREKLPRYREAEIPEVWVVDPLRREVIQDTLDPAGRQARSLTSGRLGSMVLPDFWIDVGWLFRDKLPSSVDALREILPGPL
jgi:Uma2 family endonuclease